MKLLTQYPLWLVIFALLLGVGYALYLYYKNNNVIFEKPMRIAMASLRGLAVALIAFLLLAPMVKLTVKQTDKPIVLVAIDNSESVKSNKDSAFYAKEYPGQVAKLISELGDSYVVKTYLVGDEDHLIGDKETLDMDFSDKSTNLSSLFDQVDMLYANQNVGAVVMLTDGIFNTGASPYYKAEKAGCPVYAVGLGSSELATDLFISDILHNRQTLKGNFFPVEVKVAAYKLSGKQAELTVKEGETEIYRKQLTLSGNRYFETVKFSVEAKSKGVHHYRVDLTELDGEVTHKNNHSAFFVEVVESRDKVAIVYNSPHPDVAALREALEGTDNYDVEVFPVSAEHGRGMQTLLERIVAALPPQEEPTLTKPLRVAVVGRPNAGKSSYINRLLNAERVIVSDIPGTTRDAVDVPFTIGEGPTARHYTLVDTAGMKSHTQMSKTSVDNFSLFRSEKAIEEADVVLLMMESEIGPTRQDMRIAGKILDAQKACVILMNKWDLAQEKGIVEKEATGVIRQMMPFLSFAPVVYCSAKSGYNIRRTVDAIDAVASSVKTQMPTGVLNRTIEVATKKTLAPMRNGKRLKVYYGLQVGTDPLTIRLFVNDPKLVVPAYQSYIEKAIRARFGLEGAPLRLFLKARSRKSVADFKNDFK